MTEHTKRNMPKCFSILVDWKEWRRQTILAGQPTANYCMDCIPTFKQRMVQEGRCKYPGTTFTKRTYKGTDHVTWTGHRSK